MKIWKRVKRLAKAIDDTMVEVWALQREKNAVCEARHRILVEAEYKRLGPTE